MNAIISRGGLSALVVEPALSQDLSRLVTSIALDGGATRHLEVAQDVRDEARAALRLYEPMVRPASFDEVRSWMLILFGAVANPPAWDLFDAKVKVIESTCADLPAHAWSQGASTEALRTFKFWPTPADVHKLLLDRVRSFRDRVSALQDVASAPLSSAPEGEAVEDRQSAGAEIAKKLGAFRSELAEPTQAPRSLGQVAKPAFLSAAQLSEIYRKEGLVDPRSSR